MNSSINCKGRILSLNHPIVMGVINLNNESFYQGSRYTTMDTILFKTDDMLNEGALIIDLGYMTSKPGAKISDPGEEADYIVNTVQELKKRFPDIFISIDTLHSLVAKEAVMAGADIINDITSGDYDQSMMTVVAQLQVPYIMMHMKGMPENMQNNPQYEDVVLEVLTYLKNKVLAATKAGIQDVIIDPGFGFGKQIYHNYSLLKHLGVFNILEVPVLAGLSRKSMIWKTLKITPDEALNGTTALNIYALQQGVKILRVHDVKEAMQCIQLFNMIQSVD